MMKKVCYRINLEQTRSWKINSDYEIIVQVKQAEAAERLAAKDKKERNQKIMRIIERKQNEALEGKSLEELTAMLEE